MTFDLAAGRSYASAERDGALLAIKDALPIPGVKIETEVLDHGDADGQVDESRAAADMSALAADPDVLAVVGPDTSLAARNQIPLSNGAGLVQCSPAQTAWSELTHGPLASQLRGPHPNANTFLRTVTPDLDQAAGLVDLATQRLGLQRVLLVDTGPEVVHVLTNEFVRRWNDAGGGEILPSIEFRPGIEHALAIAARSKPDGVIFFGSNAKDTATLRKSMVKAGMASLPLLVNDAATYEDPIDPRSYVDLAGPAAGLTYIAISHTDDIATWTTFNAQYRAEYRVAPPWGSAPGYACAQVLVEAIRRAATMGKLDRASVRAAATDPSATFDTLFGSILFNTAGDMVPGKITIYEAKPNAQEWDSVVEFSIPEP